MDDKLFIALIAAGAAVVGSIVPTIANLWLASMARRHESRKAVKEKQRELYSKVFSSLQHMMNAQNNEAFPALQADILQIALFGDDKSAEYLYTYYLALVDSTRSGRTQLSADQHDQHHRIILNLMRRSLGLADIEKFRLIAFRPSS